MLQTLKDIVVAVKMVLQQQSVSTVTKQIQNALAQATNSPGANRNMGILQNTILGVSRSVRQLGLSIMTYLGGRAILGFARSAIESFIAFDRGLQRSIAIMEDVDATMRQSLAETAVQVSKELNIAAEDITEAYYFLASAGLNAEQSLRAMPAVALFAKAGLVDLNTATELLVQSQAALGMRTEDATENLAQMVRLMDVLAKADNESQASLTEFAAALTNKAGASLRLFQKDVEEGVAALAVLADQGVKGKIAGERLDIFMRQVTQSALQNAEMFKKYGIEVFDSAGKMKNFADIADDLTGALGHLSDEQQVIALGQLGFQVRTVAVVKQFIGMGDAIRDYEAKLRDAGGTTRQMADVQLKAVGERLGLVQQRFLDMKRNLGEALVPALEHFIGVAGDESSAYSVISVLKSLVAWLGDGNAGTGGWGLSMILKGLIFIVVEFTNTLHMMTNVFAIVVNPVLATFGAITTYASAMVGTFLQLLGQLAQFMTGGLLGKGLEKTGDKVLEFANKASKFTAGRVESMVQNIAELSTRMTTWGVATGNATSRPELTRGLRGARANPKDPRTGSAFDDSGDPDDPSSPAGRSLGNEEDLLSRLRAMRASFSNDEKDKQLERLEELRKDFDKYYKGLIPQAVADGLDQIQHIIEMEASARAFDQMFQDMWAEAEPNPDTIVELQAFVDRLEEIRAGLEEGTTAWAEYSAVIDKANKKIDDMVKSIKDLHEEEQKRIADAELQETEERLERIRRIGERTADRLADGFRDFFNVLLIGSRKGSEAFETLGRHILAAMIAPFSDYAMLRAREAFADAATQIAKGIAAASNPLTAGLAGGHFAAAAKFAGAGALWAALGGGVGMAGQALVSGAPGLGVNSPRRSRYDSTSRVDDARRSGPDIHIFVDGMDPSNPRHQLLTGKAIKEYQERYGGNIVVNKR